jgi:hypothetical protein
MICQFYKRGNCKYGSRCRNIHEDSPSAQNSSSSAFGSPVNFGQGNIAQNSFGMSSNGGFGSSTNSNDKFNASGSGFGTASAFGTKTGGFGTTNTQSAFGRVGTSSFGTPAVSAFGSNPGGFGTTNNTQSAFGTSGASVTVSSGFGSVTSAFGTQNVQSAFGSGGSTPAVSSGFGTTNNNQSGFGTSSPFGASSAVSGFATVNMGSSNAATPNTSGFSFLNPQQSTGNTSQSTPPTKTGFSFLSAQSNQNAASSGTRPVAAIESHAFGSNGSSAPPNTFNGGKSVFGTGPTGTLNSSLDAAKKISSTQPSPAANPVQKFIPTGIDTKLPNQAQDIWIYDPAPMTEAEIQIQYNQVKFSAGKIPEKPPS